MKFLFFFLLFLCHCIRGYGDTTVCRDGFFRRLFDITVELLIGDGDATCGADEITELEQAIDAETQEAVMGTWGETIKSGVSQMCENEFQDSTIQHRNLFGKFVFRGGATCRSV